MQLTLGQALMKLVQTDKAGKAQEPDHYTTIPISMIQSQE